MFKKTAVLLVVGLCFSAQLCLAGGSITYKMNSIHPEGGDSFESHDINTYLSSEKFGMGVDTTLCPVKEYTKVKPYLTKSIGGGLSLIGGLSLDSNGSDYVHAGIWYATSLGKVSIFFDPRLYVSIAGEGNDFFDGFVEASYPLTEKVSVAFDVIYDHWWDSNDNWALVGPVVYYKISDTVTVFSRVAQDTNFEGGGSSSVRLGLKWSF